MTATLLLNATYEPLQIIDWRKAITLFYKGRVEIVAEHDTVLRSVSFTFKMPSVVRLLRMARLRRRKDMVPFTRANIYARDSYTCQYCNTAHEPEDLTFDHVVPVTAGGRRSWENIVAACVPCNRKKGGQTPEQAGMHLVRTPRKPPASPIMSLKVTIGARKTPDSWRSYLYWAAELEES